MNKLSKKQEHILKDKGTEMPFTGKYWNHHEDGSYHCAQCDQLLFKSGTKFNSGTGWPSFTDAEKGSVEFKEDKSLFMKRVEVICSKCKGHLGHVFDDGPKGKQRFCINSAALAFDKK